MRKNQEGYEKMADKKTNNEICMNLREFREWCDEVLVNRSILFNNTEEENFDNNFTCGYYFFFDEMAVGVYSNRIQFKCQSGCTFTVNRIKYIISKDGPYDEEIPFTVV